MQELQEAVEEVNDFYLEKYGRVSAAAVQAVEKNRVRLHKAEQDLRKNLALEVALRQLRAEGERRMRRRFFDLLRQTYLAEKPERERVRKGKGRARFPAENYCPLEEDGRAGPSSESGRGSERSGLVYSMPTNHPLEPSARGPQSDLSTASTTSPPALPWTPVSSSPDDANPGPATIRNPSTNPVAKTTAPPLSPLATPFSDLSLGIRTQPPNRVLHHAHPPAPVLPPPPSIPVPGRHGSSDNTAPLLPPAVYIAGAQLQERLRGVSSGPVRAVASQMLYDQQRQTQHQTMREYQIQRAKGRL